MKTLKRLLDPTNKTFLNISSFQVLVMFRRGLFFTYLSIYLRNYLGMTVTETTFFATFPIFPIHHNGDVVHNRHPQRKCDLPVNKRLEGVAHVLKSEARQCAVDAAIGRTQNVIESRMDELL